MTINTPPPHTFGVGLWKFMVTLILFQGYHRTLYNRPITTHEITESSQSQQAKRMFAKLELLLTIKYIFMLFHNIIVDLGINTSQKQMQLKVCINECIQHLFYKLGEKLFDIPIVLPHGIGNQIYRQPPVPTPGQNSLPKRVLGSNPNSISESVVSPKCGKIGINRKIINKI